MDKDSLEEVVSKLEIAHQLELLNDTLSDLDRKIDNHSNFNRSLALGLFLLILGVLFRLSITI